MFIPYGFGFNIYDFAFPSFLAASGLSAVILLFSRPDKSQKFILGAFAGLALLLLLSGFVNSIHSAFIIHSLGIVLVPLGWAVMSSQEQLKENAEKYLFRGLALLWLLNILHCYFQVFKAGQIGKLGLAGNQNWLSAIIFSTSPAAIYVVHSCVSSLYVVHDFFASRKNCQIWQQIFFCYSSMLRRASLRIPRSLRLVNYDCHVCYFNS